MAILDVVRNWQPLKIDALSIVTLLGGSSLQRVLGRLVVSPWLEYLPLLASQVVLEGTIGEPVPGFTIYNITDGIKATDLSAWWTRWLMCQELLWSSTTLDINILPSPRRVSVINFFSMALCALLCGSLIAFAVLLGDWYGFACSTAMFVLVVVRSMILSMYRTALDLRAQQAITMPQSVKLVLTLPSGKLITIHTTRGVTIHCLLTEARPPNPVRHKLCRYFGWIAFGVFIVTLGLTTLAIQLIIIVCMVIPSFLIIGRFQSDEYHVGRFIKIDRSDAPGQEFRARTYASLRLSQSEEETMVRWEFFPSPTNTGWWETYYACKADLKNNEDAFDNWPQKLADQQLISEPAPRTERT